MSLNWIISSAAVFYALQSGTIFAFRRSEIWPILKWTIMPKLRDIQLVAENKKIRRQTSKKTSLQQSHSEARQLPISLH